MTTFAALTARASGKCELCASPQDLASFAVKPNAGEGAETSVLLCATCRAHVDAPEAVGDVNHWRHLGESMWSEPTSVKVLSYRVLKKLQHVAWAQDLLGQLYLDEEQQAWADADLGSDDEAAEPTLDSNGTPLATGDTVTLVKDLEVKGANFTAKRGTTVKGISLTDDPKYVEGRVNGIRIVLVAAYLKKA